MYILVNDISTDNEFEIRLFADDCVCYREIKDIEDTVKLQITMLGQEMGYGISNCQMQYDAADKYTLEGTVLQNVENIKYLGVTITDDLRWNTNVSNICTKANRALVS